MEITLKNFQKKIPIPQAKIVKAAKEAFRKLDLFKLSLSIVFVGTKRMRAINKKYLDHDFVTDVVTFDLSPDEGEIIVCPHVASINARAHQTSTDREIVLYVIHGILHLAGYDDHTNKDILQMRRMENRLLKKR